MAALGILILNDHWLKYNHASWVSGKLSDFAGLFVFALLLSAILVMRSRVPRALAILHLAVGVAFVVWKLAPIELLTDWIGKSTGMTMPSRVKDWSDLMALSVLPISYGYIRRQLNTLKCTISSRLRTTVLQVGVLLISGWSIIATSYAWIPHQIAPEEHLSSDRQVNEVVRIIEMTMEQHKFRVHQREVVDSTSFKLHFFWSTDSTVVGGGKGGGFFLFPGIQSDPYPRFSGILTLSLDSTGGSWSVSTTLSSRGLEYDEARLSEAIREALYVHLGNAL